MRVLAVVQNKGGTGKTTMCRLLAEYFARKNRRVLGIDLDPQCSFSQRFLTMEHDDTSTDGIMPPLHPAYDPNEEWNGRSSIADIFYRREVIPYETELPGLEMIPGHGETLREVELVGREEVKDKVHDRLRDFLNISDVQASWDLVVIDTSPSKGPLTISAVRAATHILIPTLMEQQSIEGLRGMLQLWRRENRVRTEPLRIIGILANKYRKNVALQAGIYEALMNDDVVAPFMISHVLGLRAAIADADHPEAKPPSLFELPASNIARIEAETICQYVEERLF
jgi:chromosome partitioning protein